MFNTKELDEMISFHKKWHRLSWWVYPLFLSMSELRICTVTASSTNLTTSLRRRGIESRANMYANVSAVRFWLRYTYYMWKLLFTNHRILKYVVPLICCSHTCVLNLCNACAQSIRECTRRTGAAIIRLRPAILLRRTPWPRQIYVKAIYKDTHVPYITCIYKCTSTGHTWTHTMIVRKTNKTTPEQLWCNMINLFDIQLHNTRKCLRISMCALHARWQHICICLTTMTPHPAASGITTHGHSARVFVFVWAARAQRHAAVGRAGASTADDRIRQRYENGCCSRTQTNSNKKTDKCNNSHCEHLPGFITTINVAVAK